MPHEGSNRGRQRRASAAKRSPLHAGLGGAVEYGWAPANKGGTEDSGEERQGIREEFGRGRQDRTPEEDGRNEGDETREDPSEDTGDDRAIGA